MIRALLFDFDGLILDTESSVFAAWQALYREYGHDLPLADWLTVVGSETGGVRFDPALHLIDLCGLPLDPAALHARCEARDRETAATLEPLPGVLPLLEDAAARSLPLAVASSSPHEWVDGHLARLGLLDRFEAVVCSDDVARVKPAPDLFLRALDAVGAAPSEALVLEDSAHGITAARAAGVFAVAVPNAVTRHADFSHADLVLPSLAATTLDDLLAVANGGTPARTGKEQP